MNIERNRLRFKGEFKSEQNKSHLMKKKTEHCTVH